MAAVVVIRPGLQTTVQDLGRWGHQACGVPVAGAMDRTAHRKANLLVGNPPSAATLEITLAGPELEFEDDRAVGVAGASFELALDERRVFSGETIGVSAGSRLKFGQRIAGARGYLAVSGGFDVPVVLGSRSTHLPSRMGGFEGRTLRAGDRLPLGLVPSIGRVPPNVLVSLAIDARDENERVLRILPGPDLDRLDQDAFQALVSSRYRVSSDSNRMGYRLEGPHVRHRGSATKISDAVPLGTIQVPPSGQPLLLMADGPTTGGYSAAAHVITADIDRAAQLAPGDALRFAPCSLEDAREVAFAREMQLRHSEAHA